MSINSLSKHKACILMYPYDEKKNYYLSTLNSIDLIYLLIGLMLVTPLIKLK